MKFIQFFNQLTGYNFWYTVRFRYYTKNGIERFSFITEIGVTHKKHIFNKRRLNKAVHAFFTNHARKLLCNGMLRPEVICYIGWLKKDDNQAP